LPYTAQAQEADRRGVPISDVSPETATAVEGIVAALERELQPVAA
jgi:hypothetical protein